MWPFNRRKKVCTSRNEESAVSETADGSEPESIRCATANVVEESAFGEGGKGTRRGTKHFKGGAKVYVIDSFPGTCESAIVIGHHRASGRYIKLTMKAKYLGRFRITAVYSPKVIGLVREHYADKGRAFSCYEHQVQKLFDSVSSWAELERNERQREQGAEANRD